MDAYRHSGIIPVTSIVYTVLVGLAVTLIGGAIYAFGMRWIPIVYLNVLLTGAYGFMIGLAVGVAAAMGKMRNPTAVTFLGFTFGLFGVYTEWAWSVTAIEPRVGLAGFQPEVLYVFSQFLFEKGSWGLGRNGGMVHGYPLMVLWGVEAFAIVALATTVCRGSLDTPFCEECDSWTVVEENAATLACSGQESAWQRVATGDWSAIKDLPAGITSDGKSVRISIAQCPSCSETRYATASTVTMTVDQNGQVQEAKQPFIKHVRVSDEALATIRAKQAEWEAIAAASAKEVAPKPTTLKPPTKPIGKPDTKPDASPADLLDEFEDEEPTDLRR